MHKNVTYELPVSHADYPYVTFVSSDENNPGEYRLDRLGRYTYELNSSLPQKIKGFIHTPATENQPEGMVFGLNKGEVEVGGPNAIVYSNPTAGVYTISFNSFNFDHAPNLSFKFDGVEMDGYDENSAMADVTLSKDQVVRVDIPDFDTWWIDPDYFSRNSDGSLTFIPNGGTYRVMAYTNYKYLRVYKISGDKPASMNATGLGALWLMGEGVGKPSYKENPVGWNSENALCFASSVTKVYELTFVGGSTINTNGFNIKLSGNMNGSDAFTSANITTVDSNLAGLGSGSDGHANGEIYLLDGVTLKEGATYLLKVDVSKGKRAAVLTFEELH